jgi:hypothetical protein
MNNHHPPPDYPGAHHNQQHHHQQQPHHQGGRHPVGQARSTISHSSHVSGPPGSVRSGPLPPGQHTMVTVNTDPTPGARVTEINLNLGYYKTLPGILKIIQLVSNVITITRDVLPHVIEVCVYRNAL